MRALSGRQAARCEEAETPRCKCRCGGALHGARRTPAYGTDLAELQEPDARAVMDWLARLPEEDPHHVRSKTRKLELQGAA